MERRPGHPWVIAHRGASAALHENTLAAFEEARRLGADAVEFDVRRTADGALVIHHDQQVTDVGLIVDMELSELRRRAPWIPTFAEAMIASTGMWVNAEIKNSPTERDWDPGDGVLEAVLGHLAATDAADRVLISSFNPKTVARAAKRIPGLQTGLLVGKGVDPLGLIPSAAEAGHATIHPNFGTLVGRTARRVVEAAARHRMGVVVWTVDSPGDIRRLAETGVAGIITNTPDVARSVLDA